MNPTKIEERVQNGKMELTLIHQLQTHNGRGQWLLLHISDMVQGFEFVVSMNLSMNQPFQHTF
jgi:hypothetical protein